MNHIKESALEEGVNSELSTRNRRQFIEIASLAAAYSVYAGCGGNEMTGPSRVDPPTTVPPTTEPPTTTPTPQAPIFLNHMPTGELPAGTKEYPISVDTIDDTVARFALQPDFRYEDMVNLFTTTGTKRHETILRNLNNGQEITVNVRGKDVLTGVTNMADYRWTFSIAQPEVFKIPIVGLFTGRPIGNGSARIEARDLNIPIIDSNMIITKEMGLPPGQYVVGPITTDLGLPRYAIVDYDGNTMSVNLGGGRTESPLNVIEKGHIDLNDFERYCLRSAGRSNRIVSPLNIGLLDSFVYSVDGRTGNLQRRESHIMNETARTNLYNALNQSGFWAPGVYPDGDLLAQGLLKVQSRGDEIPENRSTNGWWIIYPDIDIPPGSIIRIGDSSASRTAPPDITWAYMRFLKDWPIELLPWTRDTRESYGWRQVRDSASQTDTMRRYAMAFFYRSPGLTVADGIDRATSYNPSPQTNPSSRGFFGVLEGVSKIFTPAFRK
jgi:hypothetical protein